MNKKLIIRGLSRWSSWLTVLFAVVWAPSLVSAQGVAVGTVQGRIYNPATSEYVRNAEIRVEGTELLAYSEEGGYYQLENVPVGQAAVRVSYTGYAPQTARVTVSAGQSSVQDFNLAVTGARPAQDQEGAIMLEAVTVSSDREGNAKAIMEQRRNMNISTSVAADVFGDVSEGNVGEFLKFLPGVDIEYVDGVSRGPRVGGLDQQYVGVTMNGASLASADAYVAYGATINGTAGGSSRSVGFEQMSITSIESIEVNRTLSADMDANAPAGTINLKTKRAFDRKGRRIDWQVSLGANSGAMTLAKRIGPDDYSRYQVRPSYQVDYSDVFLNQRLGLRLGVASSDILMQQQYVTHTYNKTPTAADPRPMVLTALTFADGPKFVQRFNTNLAADFKASSRLVLSFSGLFNAFGNLAYTKNLVFTAAANSTAAATGRQHALGDLTEIRTDGLTTNTARTFGHAGGSAVKLTNTITLTPRFEYKLHNLTVDGTFNYSRSKNDYETAARGTIRSETVNNVVADFRASRPSTDSAEWTITQLSGPDWSNIANFTNPRITEEGRFALTEIYTGELNGKYVLPWSAPTFVKFGAKTAEESRKTDNLTPYYIWNYIGPGGGPTGNFALYPSPRPFNTDFGRITALTVSNLPSLISRNALAQAFLGHPEWFVNSATTDNYYNAFIANRRDFRQNVDAGYGLANTRLGQWQFQMGLRWERTETRSQEFDPLPAAQLQAAGYPFNASTRRATTIPGIMYQYLTLPRVTRLGVYDDLFPSASVKYLIRPNLHAQFGYSYAISRPPIDALSGVWSINDLAKVITAPNPNLLPEYSDNYVARLAYYFEPVGSFTVLVQQTEITNQRVTQQISAAEYGYGDDPNYADYDFNTQVNNSTLYRYRSLELSYNQMLSFLPGVLRTTSVNLSYTRNYANQLFAGVTPHKVSAGLGWTWGRFSARVNGIWADDTPYYATSLNRYLKRNLKVDLNAGLRLGRNTNLFLQGRNIFNDPQLIYEGVADRSIPPALYRYGNYGVNWTLGVKGNF